LEFKLQLAAHSAGKLKLELQQLQQGLDPGVTRR
jgi:hypothetical protein